MFRQSSINMSPMIYLTLRNFRWMILISEIDCWCSCCWSLILSINLCRINRLQLLLFHFIIWGYDLFVILPWFRSRFLFGQQMSTSGSWNISLHLSFRFEFYLFIFLWKWTLLDVFKLKHGSSWLELYFLWWLRLVDFRTD